MFKPLRALLTGLIALGLAGPLPSWAAATTEATPERTDQPESSERIEQMRAWVEEVEAHDYMFWRRYIDRLERDGAQFPQPKKWYRPAEIVEGGESAPLVRLSPDERTISTAALNDIRDYAMARKTGALIVARNGVVEYEHYAPGVHSASLLTSRSLAKTVMTSLYGRAIEEGIIRSIDDPVGTYLEEWADDPRGQITIRQLLSFTSGLEMVEMGDFDPDSKAIRLAEGGNVNKTALSYQIATAPDRVMTVNNADSQLAGLVLERATGKRYADIVSEWLWRPMGAGAATINLDGLDGNARNFCCMQVRSVDWIRFGQLLMAGGKIGADQIIPASHIDRMRVLGPVNPLIALGLLDGWDIGDAPDGRKHLIIPQSAPFKSRGLFYLLGGRSITLWIAPEHDLVIYRWGDDVRDWDNSFIVNRVIDGLNE